MPLRHFVSGALGLLLCLPLVVAAADSVPALVLTSENRPDADTSLVVLHGDDERGRVVLGRVGEFGRTDTRLVVLAQHHPGWRLRQWDLQSGTELESRDLPRLAVTPLLNISGFNPGLFLDPKGKLALWIGVRDVEVERKPGRVVIREKKQRYTLGGLDLTSGESFEIDVGAGVLPGALPTPLGGDRIGTFIEGQQFLLLDRATRKLDVNHPVSAMVAGRWYADGVGIIGMTPGRQFQRHTDPELEPVDPPEPLLNGESIAGQVRFRLDANQKSLALVALGGRDQPETELSVRDARSGEVSRRMTVPIRLTIFEAGQSGSICLFRDKQEKRAVRVNCRDGTQQVLDYSKYEKAELIMDLATDD